MILKKLYYLYLLTVLNFTLFSCKSIENKNELPKQTNYRLLHQKQVKLVHADVTGIIYSEAHKSFWVQKKSENEPYIYLIDAESGVQKDKIFVRGTAYDWEGIASNSRDQSIHIGDIGDVAKSRQSIQIYAFDELSVNDHFVVPEIRNYTYPDGPRNAKAMLFHPKTKEYFIFTYGDISTEVYSISSTKKRGTLKKVGELSIKKLTDIQISSNENEILLVADNQVSVFSFKKNKEFITCLENNIPKYTKRLTDSIFQTVCFYGPNSDICYLTYNPTKNVYYFTLEEKVDSF